MVTISASEFRESLDFQGRKLEFVEKSDPEKRQERAYLDRTGNAEGGLANVNKPQERNKTKAVSTIS